MYLPFVHFGQAICTFGLAACTFGLAAYIRRIMYVLPVVYVVQIHCICEMYNNIMLCKTTVRHARPVALGLICTSRKYVIYFGLRDIIISLLHMQF